MYNLTNSKIILLEVILIIFLISCNQQNQLTHQIINKWIGKEILFPKQTIFTIYGEDTVNLHIDDTNFKIISYVDSAGCMNCKLGLDKWLNFKGTLDSIAPTPIPLYFYMYPKSIIDLKLSLKEYRFNMPICIDINNDFNNLNHLPTEFAFQTFLLDKNNKVIAMGNPIHNSKIRNLYLDIIRGKKTELFNNKKTNQTEIKVNKTPLSLGSFDWRQEQSGTFVLENIGNTPLVIEDVNTSCGCTSVNYSKKPVSSGDSVQLIVTYKAEQPEHFNKAVTVYCNAKTSPIILQITGNAI